MTDRNEATERILLVIIPLSLIFIFGRRLFFPDVDAEWPSPTVNFLTIASELGMLIGVVGLTLRRLKSSPRPGAGAGPWMVLPVIGALAGVGLFVIRMGGGHGGELPPRLPPQRSAFADTRPEAPVDYTQGGELLAAAVQTIRAQFGVEPIFKEIRISREGIGIVARDPQSPKQSVTYFSDPGRLARGEDFTPSSRSLLSEGDLREAELFSVDDADWTRVPAVARAGLEKIPIPGGRVFDVALVRRIHPLEEYPADWKVHVTGGGLIGGESGTAFFDAKSGELTDLELPKSLVKPVAYLEPENTRRLLATILEDFPPETRFIELTIDDGRALLTATRPKHSHDLRRYGYTATERAKLGKHPPIPVDDPKARGGIFTAAEVASFVPRIDALRASAFKRLGMKDGKLQSMAFWRKHMVHSPSKNLLLEFRCISPTVGDGYIVYELSGKEFYVALP